MEDLWDKEEEEEGIKEDQDQEEMTIEQRDEGDE